MKEYKYKKDIHLKEYNKKEIFKREEIERTENYLDMIYLGKQVGKKEKGSVCKVILIDAQRI